jgi:hypothetical protein
VTAVIVVQATQHRVRVQELDGLDGLREVFAERQGAHSPEAFERKVSRCARRMVEIQESLFTEGLHRVQPLQPQLLDNDAPGVAELLASHAAIEFRGERFPARLLFQPQIGDFQGRPRALIQVRIAALRLLLEAPYAPIKALTQALQTEFPSIDAAAVSALLGELGISRSVMRTDLQSIVANALEQVAPTPRLREQLRSHLDVDRSLTVAKCPWPAWWQFSMGTAGEGDNVAFVRDVRTTMLIPRAVYAAAEECWKRYKDLGVLADQPWLQTAFAELLTTAVMRDAGSEADSGLRAKLFALFQRGTQEQSLPRAAEINVALVSGGDLAAMLRSCPVVEWPIVFERLSVSQDELEDRLLDTLAFAVQET